MARLRIALSGPCRDELRLCRFHDHSRALQLPGFRERSAGARPHGVDVDRASRQLLLLERGRADDEARRRDGWTDRVDRLPDGTGALPVERACAALSRLLPDLLAAADERRR